MGIINVVGEVADALGSLGACNPGATHMMRRM